FTVRGRVLNNVQQRNTEGGTAPASSSTADADRAALYLTSEQRARAKNRNVSTPSSSTSLPSTSVKTGIAQGVVLRGQSTIGLRMERIAQEGVVAEIGTMGQYLIIR